MVDNFLINDAMCGELNISESPCISVILPAFNAQDYVGLAVQSILAQTFTEFELLFIDDGSTDQTLRIVKNITLGDSRVRIISRPNLGLVATLNEGVFLAKSNLIARMDADDIALPNRFQKQFVFLQEHPSVVCLGTAVEMIDYEGWLVRRYNTLLTHYDIHQAHLRGATSICHPTVMMRKDSVLQAGGYRPNAFPAEDLDLFLRLAQIGELANFPEILLQYRWHGINISARDLRQSEMLHRLANAARCNESLPPLPPLKKGKRVRIRSGGGHARGMARTALDHGYSRTAKKWAIRAIILEPWHPSHWWLYFHALLCKGKRRLRHRRMKNRGYPPSVS